MGKHRIVVHVDMDAFYAAVEQLDHPEYRGKPVVVGADPAGGRGRGVVSAASYEAREYGIHSALPISTAYRRCPQAVYLRPRFSRYEQLSGEVMGILGEFTPLVEQLSIDEAFLDCTGTGRLFGTPAQLGRRIRGEIRSRTRLTASVGIATNKSIAKIASELSKPDGLMICPPGGEGEFLAPLPLSYLWGAGPKTGQRLESLGYRKIGDVAGSTRESLVRQLGKWGGRLWELANGIDDRPVEPGGCRKSISEEVTFGSDTGDMERVEKVLFAIADRLTRKMRGEGMRGRTITLKIRLEGFETHTRSCSLDRYLDDTETVRSTAVELLRGFNRGGKRVRLIGVGVSNLQQRDRCRQLGLFDAQIETRGKKADRILDMMRSRYGDKVTRASFLPPSP